MVQRDNVLPPEPRGSAGAAPFVSDSMSPSASTAHRYPLKTLWLRTHLYLGLFGGALFVLMSLTGSFLVFYKAIDEWLHPRELTTTSTGMYRPLQEIVSAAQGTVPSGGWLDSISMPEHEHGVYYAWYKVPTGKAAQFRWHQVAIDPYAATVLSRDREWGGYLVSFVYELHQSLVMDEPGETILGFVGMCLLLSILTGLYLWWPRPGRLRQALTFTSGGSTIRRYYHWHKLSGFYSALILGMLALTGIYLEFSDYVVPIVRLFSPVQEFLQEEPLQSTPISGTRPVSIDQVVFTARQIFPHGELRFIGFPYGKTGVYQLTFRQPDEVLKSSGSSQIWLDQYGGTVLRVVDWHRFTGGETFLAWLFPLHNGEAFGLIGRWIVFVCGFVPLILYVTGLRMWWLKRTAHQRQKTPDARMLPS